MIEQLLGKLGAEFDKRRIPYMIIGGQAVLIYGRTRLTRDIDITLGVDIDKLESIKSLCADLGFTILTKDVDSFVPQTHILPAEDPLTQIRMDFIFSFTPYESQAIQRATPVAISGCQVKFASKEDLIIHKLFAGRAIDIEDVKGIIQKSASPIDTAYIQKWLAEFSAVTEGRDLTAEFEHLIAN